MSSILLSSEIILHLLTLLRKACIALHSATVAIPLKAAAAYVIRDIIIASKHGVIAALLDPGSLSD